MDRRGALKVLGLAGSALTALVGLPKLVMASWAKTAFEPAVAQMHYRVCMAGMPQPPVMRSN